MDNNSIGGLRTMAGGAAQSGGYTLSPGSTLGQYRVIRQLGRGGMGEVYEAENIVNRKRIALKVLPKAATGGTFVDRFRIESRVMSDLRQDNIVQVHHAGEEDGLYYLTMDLVLGCHGEPWNLEDVLSQRRGGAEGTPEDVLTTKGAKGGLPEGEVRAYALQILGALEYAHGKGVVHRDLKPANVLVAEDGTLRVTDFGLAKIVGNEYLQSVIERSISLSMGSGGSLSDMDTMGSGSGGKRSSSTARALLGTYDYMAPEQKSGGEITPRTDIYAFGIMLYLMLTGEKPEGRWKLPSEYGVSKGWDGIVGKCMERSPADRYATVTELTLDLQRTLLQKSQTSRKWIAIGVVLALAVGAGAWWLSTASTSRDGGRGPVVQSAGRPEAAPPTPSLGGDAVVDAQKVTVSFVVNPAGARLSVFSDRGLVQQRETDSKGKLTVDLVPGRYEIEAQSDGYQLLSQAVDVTGAATHTLELTPLRGSLTALTTPGATVTASGSGGEISLGTADAKGDLRYERLLEGQYTLRFSHPDHEPATESVRIVQGRPQQVRQILKGKPGALYVSASPQAEVWVDGARKGATGELLAGLPAGTRNVEVRQTGYRTERFSVDIPPNREAPRKVLGNLKREAGTVRVEVDVPGPAGEFFAKAAKRVRVGGADWQAVGTLPHTQEGVACESHDVFLEVTGFRVDVASRRVTVEDGKTATARFTLTPEPAKLTVTANAPSAEVFDASGKRLGAVGSALEVPSLQSLTLILRASGFAEKTERLAAMDPGKSYRREVVLEEVRGPVAGRNWTSPATGMEFVWIEALKLWVGKYEVTNGEYRRKESGHDSKSYENRSLNGERQPVVYVNFDDAKAYAAWLTERDKAQLGGMRYRVPSEQEFMTYAQCGDGREYPWGNNWPPRSGQAGNYHGQEGAGNWDKIAGYNDGHPVTCDVEKSWANPWGLYGVGGNVWEVCAKDSSGGSFGAWRGASWFDYLQDYLRCAYRSDYGGSYRDGDLGFRLVLSR